MKRKMSFLLVIALILTSISFTPEKKAKAFASMSGAQNLLCIDLGFSPSESNGGWNSSATYIANIVNSSGNKYYISSTESNFDSDSFAYNCATKGYGTTSSTMGMLPVSTQNKMPIFYRNGYKFNGWDVYTYDGSSGPLTPIQMGIKSSTYSEYNQQILVSMRSTDESWAYMLKAKWVPVATTKPSIKAQYEDSSNNKITTYSNILNPSYGLACTIPAGLVSVSTSAKTTSAYAFGTSVASNFGSTSASKHYGAVGSISSNIGYTVLDSNGQWATYNAPISTNKLTIKMNPNGGTAKFCDTTNRTTTTTAYRMSDKGTKVRLYPASKTGYTFTGYSCSDGSSLTMDDYAFAMGLQYDGYYEAEPTSSVTYTAQYTQDMNVTTTSFNGGYDGSGHSIKLSGIPSGATIEYSTDNKNWSTTNPSYTEVGTNITVYWRASKTGYTSTSGSGTVKISKGTMTGIRGSNVNTSYNGYAQSITVSGAPSGSTITYSTTEGGTYTSTKPTYTNVGTYTTYYKVSKANYNDFIGYGTVTISNATLSGVSASSYNKAYDGNTHSISVSAPSGSTVTYSSTESGSYTSSKPTYTNVGTYTTYYKVSKPNYNDYKGSATVTITNATLTGITSSGYDDIYDENPHSIDVSAPDGCTITYSDTENGTYTSTKPTYTNVGTYTTYYKVSKANYNEVKGSNTVKISNATLSGITASGYDGNYTETSHQISVSAPSGSTITYSLTEDGIYSSTNPTFTDVCNTRVYYKVTKPNYNEATGHQDIIITNATLTDVIATNYNASYDKEAHSIDVSAPDGCTITYSDTEDGIYTSIKPTYTNVGTYTTYYKVNKANYNEVNGSATVTITNATLTGITSSGYDDVYDENPHSIDVTVPDGCTITYSDTEDGIYTIVKPTYTNVGTYTTYYKVNKANYNEVKGSNTVKISNATLSVTSNGYNGIYDENPHSIDVSVPDGCTVTYSDTEDGTYTTTNPEYSNVGNYTVYYKVSKDNYETVSGSKTVTITNATLAGITASGYDDVYDENPHSIVVTTPDGCTITYCDTEDGTYTSTKPTYTNVGTYITYYKITKPNYNEINGYESVVISNNTLKDITSTGFDGIYDSNSHSINVTVPDEATIEYSTNGKDYSSINPSFTNVGEYTVYYRISKANHHTYSNSNTITIRNATLHDVSAIGYENSYDGQNHSITLTAPDGCIVTYSTDNVTYSSTKPQFSDVGDYTVYYKIEKENYETVNDSAQVKITNATISATITGYHSVYDGKPHNIVVSVTNPSDAVVEYSTDNKTWSSINPSFTDACNVTVYYRISKTNYNTLNGSANIKIDELITPKPTIIPTPVPTPKPTIKPTPTPIVTPKPTVTPTPTPTINPTPTPTMTSVPTITPTSTPTIQPTIKPELEDTPTPIPTETPIDSIVITPEPIVVETITIETPMIESVTIESVDIETPIIETIVVETPIVETIVIEIPIVESDTIEDYPIETPEIDTQTEEIEPIQTGVPTSQPSSTPAPIESLLPKETFNPETPSITPTATPTGIIEAPDIPDWDANRPTPTPIITPSIVPSATPTIKPTMAPSIKPSSTPQILPTTTPNIENSDNINIKVEQKNIIMKVNIKISAKQKAIFYYQELSKMKKVKIKSLNKKIATMNRKFVIQGKKKGIAKFTITYTKNNCNYKILLKVKITKSKKYNQIKIFGYKNGKLAEKYLKLKKYKKMKVKYSSLKPKVVKVNKKGKYIFLKKKPAKIKVKINKQKYTIKVKS